jgi:hypothetical protein
MVVVAGAVGTEEPEDLGIEDLEGRVNHSTLATVALGQARDIDEGRHMAARVTETAPQQPHRRCVLGRRGDGVLARASV